MPRRKKRRAISKKAPDGSAIAFGTAHSDFLNALISTEMSFQKAFEAHERLQASTYTPRGASVLFKRRDDLAKLLRRLQRNLDTL